MKITTLILKTAFVTLLLSLIIFNSASAQSFGKNKVQYKKFNWHFIQSKHFDIYFSDGGYDIAEFTAVVAETSLASLSKNLDYNISNRIPLIVFNSHNDFQQNNVIDEYLPEGVGGVTELFKNRILVPFEGNYEQFRHVIHHELLHGFMNDMFYGGSIQNIISKNITLNFPIWFSEGMAESQSLSGLDKETDMYVRDLVINNNMPPIEYCYGYLAYRGGQSFFAFLMEYYGEHKIGELMNSIKATSDVYGSFKETYKLTVEKLSEKWLKELNKTYWSDAINKEEVFDFAKKLTDHIEDGGFYNVSPTISPKGDMFAFISNRDDFFDVFLAKTDNGEIIEKVISGNTTSNFEELQILTPGLTWSPDSRKLAISVKAGEDDAIFIVDVKSGKENKLPVKLTGISNVNWSPFNNILAFTGKTAKQSDIYIYDIYKHQLKNLTNDIFSDENPVWSPDGKYIYFNSDRGKYVNRSDIPADFKIYDYDFNERNLYRLNFSTQIIEPVIYQPGSNEKYIQFSSDGKKMLYVSDVNGINNIYMRISDDEENSTDIPITNSINPISQISVSKDGKKMLFVALNKGGYDIFKMDNPFDRNIGLSKLEPTSFVKKYQMKKSVTVKYDSSEVSADSLEISGVEDSLSVNSNDSLNIYGQDIRIEFKKPGEDKKELTKYDTQYESNKEFKVFDNINEDGSFKTNKYKIKFSPDLVYGNANYSSYYGVQGVASISLSDLMGNHRINIITSMVIDLKNSDYALAYYYLPNRLDLGFEIYHTARFLYYNRGLYDQLYRYRTYGANILSSYPITKFKRFDAGLSLMHVIQENLDNINEPIYENTFLVPSVSYVFDNSLWGYIAPIKGSRFNITTLGSPPLGSNGIEFISLLGDFRKYFKIADDYSFALRFAGGASFGKNPQRFYLGGTEGWINWEFENYNIPISNIEEYAFSMAGLPLRGYNFDRIAGSKYALFNAELRFPLLRYLILGLLPFGFQNVQGNIFFDAGTAWRKDRDLKLITTENGTTVAKDLLMGMGIGTRIVFLGFPFKFDVAWNYNLKEFSPPKYYISLGLDF
ncbi:MAG: PD40 domain-containing protein [Ignavibacteria bacterium]|nr:PD40 domain-containing protein [Ignavibacteria bacterium]